MSAAWMWIRLDLRRRVRSLLVLALLVAVTTTVVLTAVAGSRRGASALDRLLEQTKPATIAVLPNETGFDWEAVEAMDGVEAVGQFPVSSYVVDGLPEGPANFPYDGAVMHTIETPVVLEGRLADPARDDEVVVSQAFEANAGKGVGDAVTIRLYSPEQMDTVDTEGAELTDPEGSVIEARIVGVIRSPWFSDYGTSSRGTLVPSAGLLAQHRDELVGSLGLRHINALVRLEDGGDAVPEFREELAEVTGRRDIGFFDLAGGARHLHDVADFEADALLVFAAAAGIAALFLVGQSIVRYVAGTTAELSVLRSVGMRPRHVRTMAAVGPTLAAVVGGAVGTVGAFVVSDRFPVGTAAPFEPAPGRQADAAVLVVGFTLVVVLVVAGALTASWLAGRTYAHAPNGRPSRVAAIAGRLGAPVPVAVGSRFALERGSGRQSVPVLPALVGSVVGVVGIVAALTFADGVHDATSHPERFGMYAELEAFVGFDSKDFAPVDDVAAALAAVDGVAAVNDNRTGVAQAGSVDVTTFSLDPVGDPPPIVMIEGALPATADEVALAPATAEAIGVDVGDRFDLTGSASTANLLVTGLAFVPEGSHNEYDSGAWLTDDGFAGLIDGFKFHLVDITVQDGADPETVKARIDRELGAAFEQEEGSEIAAIRVPPARVDELKQLRRLPLALAAFLALLAVTAVGHAVATAVRRRRRDLAVLRALGLTRWQTRSIAVTQAVVLALVGLVVGVPLGIALGRSLWRSVAESTPVLHVVPVALLALILIAPIALLLAVLLAAWPSHRAASLRVGYVLRTE